MAEKLHTSYQIRWKNYKSFEDTGWITLRPLTVLIGPNSSGKSSVHSPLLLLAQTLDSSDGGTSLVVNGSLIDAGNYKSVIHMNDVRRELFFGLRFHSHEPKKGKKLKKIGEYPPGEVHVTFSHDSVSKSAVLKRFEVFDIYRRLFFRRALLASSTGKRRYNLSGVLSSKRMKSVERKAIGVSGPVNFLFSSNRTLSNLSQEKDAPTSARKFSEEFSKYVQGIGYLANHLYSILFSLSYIGPLRRRPERYYRYASESKTTVGPQGENAPNLFRTRTSARREINRWVNRFELGEKLKSINIGDNLFELCLAQGRQELNLADVGFGASQVLPLIVQAAVAPKGSLTIAEQPEIHLNPKLQGELANLFVRMVQTGHRVIVETHSEHLLVRLRTLIASKQVSVDQVAIYFVGKQNDKSSVREVELQSDGNILSSSWPAGFFDDALREALALASAQEATSKT